jgi:hypothetical protein
MGEEQEHEITVRVICTESKDRRIELSTGGGDVPVLSIVLAAAALTKTLGHRVGLDRARDMIDKATLQQWECSKPDNDVSH